MARKIDPKAKQRKQMIVLAVGGVLLLGLLAIQLPKLMKQSGPPASASEEPASTAGATDTAAGGSTSAGAVLVGAATAGGAPAAAGDGQLWSFSRFTVKDPFKPGVTEDGGTAASAGSEARTPPPIDQGFDAGEGSDVVVNGKPVTVDGQGSGASSGGGGKGGTAAKPAPPAYATIEVNGKAEQLQLKQKFPAADPMFVLAKLGKGVAHIGVAGGSFTSGETVPVRRGGRVTLMNTATGARYVVKVLYVGAEPEAIEQFSAAPPAKKK